MIVVSRFVYFVFSSCFSLLIGCCKVLEQKQNQKRLDIM